MNAITCPNAADHTVVPVGYVERAEDAWRRLARGELAARCPGCGLFAVWALPPGVFPDDAPVAVVLPANATRAIGLRRVPPKELPKPVWVSSNGPVWPSRRAIAAPSREWRVLSVTGSEAMLLRPRQRHWCAELFDAEGRRAIRPASSPVLDVARTREAFETWAGAR